MALSLPPQGARWTASRRSDDLSRGRESTGFKEGDLHWINIIEEPAPVREPHGLVYRTHPREALAKDDQRYILKGPDAAVVFAEHAAYGLAEAVGVPVPEHGLCEVPGAGVHFASRKLPCRIPVDSLWEDQLVENPEMLAMTAALDIWIANDDRNINNIVADLSGNGARLYAIDFERSRVLDGKNDRFSIAAMDPREMLPKEQLREYCRGLAFPRLTCNRIESMGCEAIGSVAAMWSQDTGVPPVDWCSTAESVLRQRAEKIHDLVKEARS